ncbi:MAG: CCA tRNA nucleotidyltransferase [Acidimicrobiia bacterium]
MAESIQIPEAAQKLGELFHNAGFELYVVGGAVRDRVLGLSSFDDDIDMTTNARPPDILRLISPLASAVWRQGERFGTIGANVFDRSVEITTYRSESYEGHSRKPVVGFGDDLRTDLSRRDFTINEMALSARTGELHDPFAGVDDLARKILRTPLSPEVSFNDDPLRMLRAARFAARLGLRFDGAVVDASKVLAPRMEIVSGERIFAEIERLLELPDPAAGVEFLWQTGILSASFDRARLSSYSTVETAITRMAAVVPVDTGVRWAALCQLTGVDVEEVSELLRMSTDRRKDLKSLTTNPIPTAFDPPTLRRMILWLGRFQVNRIVAMEMIVARMPAAHLEDFRTTFNERAEQEPAVELVSPLFGSDILEILEIEPGPLVGQIRLHLESLAIENGPLSREEAVVAARAFLAPD